MCLISFDLGCLDAFSGSTQSERVTLAKRQKFILHENFIGNHFLLLLLLHVGDLINAQATPDLHQRHQLLDCFFQDDHIIQQHGEGDFGALIDAFGTRGIGSLGRKGMFVLVIEIQDGLLLVIDKVGREQGLDARC